MGSRSLSLPGHSVSPGTRSPRALGLPGTRSPGHSVSPGTQSPRALSLRALGLPGTRSPGHSVSGHSVSGHSVPGHSVATSENYNNSYRIKAIKEKTMQFITEHNIT